MNRITNILIMHKGHIILLFVTVFSIMNIQLYSQKNTDSLDHFLNSIHEIYGPDDNLISGFPYVLQNKNAHGNPYLINNQWSKATIFINGKTYRNQQVKYNIHKNELILKAKIGQQGYYLIQTNKNMIDSFKINNRLFVNSFFYLPEKSKKVFYEEIFSNEELTFVRQFSKNFTEPYNSIYDSGEYSDKEENRYIISNNERKKVDRKYFFIHFFPKENRKHIRNFLKKNSIDYKSANLSELIKLSNYAFNKNQHDS